jgi:hypothetical protein
MRHGSRRGGVMMVPAILACNDWEAIASVSQDKLIADSYEDRSVPQRNPVVMGTDPADLSHRYR